MLFIRKEKKRKEAGGRKLEEEGKEKLELKM